MQKHIYDLRYQVDKEEWRARAKRALVFQLWNQYRVGNNTAKMKMFDFGCGVGVLPKECEQRYPGITTYGIDISKKAIDYCKLIGLKNVKEYGGKTIPFKDSNFDLVTAIDVLEHIKDDYFALKEIKRVLKKGGIGIFLVPSHQALYSTRDIRLQHKRRYEKGELTAKCQESGFKVLASKNADFALYFLLLAMCKMAQKKKGVPDLKMETASTNKIINEIMYSYELLENWFQNIATFPIGISSIVVVRK